MQENWYELMETVQRKQELERVVACNEKTKSFGLTLTEEEAGRLMAGRRESLRTQMRVEFGKGILPEIIETFCDSPYLQQENYADDMSMLQFHKKNSFLFLVSHFSVHHHSTSLIRTTQSFTTMRVFNQISLLLKKKNSVQRLSRSKYS